jgi:DNA-binding transcriptional ArsR family regulator
VQQLPMIKRNRSRNLENKLYERRAGTCKALVNPVRLKIIDLIDNRTSAVSELLRELGISEANLSQHHAVLEAAGIVGTRRDGKRIHCYLSIAKAKKSAN